MDRRKIVYYHRAPKLYDQRTVKKKLFWYRAKVLTIFVAFCFGYFALSNTSNKKTEDVLAARSETATEQVIAIPQFVSALQNVPLPASGQTAIGTLEQGVIKYSDNETQAPIASITKIITSLVILEKSPLELGEKGPAITLNERDKQYFESYYAKLGTVTGVEIGATMSQYEALQAILLPSSNNMADSLVDRHFSSMDEYLSYANNFLQQHGLSKTIVADASGFSPGSKSTPTDLIKLGQLALQNPVLAEIVAQPNASITVGGDIPNYNPLIHEPDVVGIKPGTTDEAGYCLLMAAKLPDASGKQRTFIAATMGHQDRQEYVQSMKQLLASSRSALLTAPQ
ncbi:D-alanyl-D-alanine carboxypeptidase [Candidatus Saccharibacteria bacterium]|nr:D-alanyl-D-alanine carboxypeptidase [Candidatus Saccharibacteria bacterium]